MSEDQTHRLADGRVLGYAEYGDPQGRPVFFFHGFPGTRHLGRATDEPGRERGLRMICPDRPGFGLSDFMPGRRIADWPKDVVALADALELERFGVIGVSGGGSYAAACARFIPERLGAVALVGAMGPMDAPGATEGMGGQNRVLFGLGRWVPGLVGRLMASMMRRAARDPEKFLARMKGSLPEPDQRALEDPKTREVMMASFDFSRPDAGRAMGQELALVVEDWGFALRDIPIEVHVFQGEQDRNVSPNMGRYFVEQIPSCTGHFYPDEAHISVFASRGEEILGIFA
jgi:pimeloyl-ACP methyl ester carboxylesterase